VGLAGAGLDANGNVADPRLATAAIGAGHPAEGTFPGLNITEGGRNARNTATIEGENTRNTATLAERAASAHEATVRAAATQEAIAKRQAETERYKHDNTPYAGYDAEGRPAPVTSQSRAVQGAVYPAITEGQAKGAVINRALTPPRQPMQPGAPEGFVNPLNLNGQPQNLTGDIIPPGGTNAQPSAPAGQSFENRFGAAYGNPPVAPAAPSGAPPPGYVHPLVQEALGFPKGAASYQHLQSGAIGQSYDGGVTINGHPAGSGWVAITPQEAISGTRELNDIQQAGRPLPPRPGAYPQTAIDAAKTSGLGSAIQHEANSTWGMLGGGEVGAGTNRARENLENNAATVRSIMLATPGHASNQVQRWANELVPQPGFLGVTGANPVEQKNKMMSFIGHMRDIYDLEAAEAQDRNTEPALRRQLLGHMSQLKRAIEMYEAPTRDAGSTAPQAPAPQAAPQGVPSKEEIAAEMRRRGLMQ
jgi:hypothetical protein